MTPVKVNILDKEYLIGCEESEKASLTEAANYLTQQMQTIRDTGKIIGAERIAVLAALNITHELLAKEQGSDQFDATLPDRISKLIHSVNKALDPQL